MNDQGRSTREFGPARRGVIATLAVALCLVPVLAPAQQQDPARLPAGDLPTQAAILEDPLQDGFPIEMIDFVDVDIRDVMLFFGQLTGLNIVLDPEVSGPVTIQLFGVPGDSALLTILESHNLGYEIQRNIVRVTTLQKLADAAQAEALLMDNAEAAMPLVTRRIELSYASARL